MLKFLEQALGLVGLSLAAFEVYATVLRARKRPGPLSERLNRAIWWCASKMTRSLSRPGRHAVLESVGPLLLPLLAGILVLLMLVSFGLLYMPYLPASFHVANTGDSFRREALYFSGVTFLTIGYGDVTPNSGPMRALALLEGTAGLAVFSLFTAYLLTVNEAVQRKRAAALSLYHQASKGADVPGLVAHHYRRGRFYGFEELFRKSSNDVQIIMETHIEHPVIHFYHSAAIYKSFPRMLFVMLETAAITRTMLDPEACLEIIDHPDLVLMEESAFTVVKEMLVVLELEAELEQSGGPPESQRRQHRCFQRAASTLAASQIPLDPQRQASFKAYRDRRSQWEKGLFVLARFLGYDWLELTGDDDLSSAHEDESERLDMAS